MNFVSQGDEKVYISNILVYFKKSDSVYTKHLKDKLIWVLKRKQTHTLVPQDL